MIKVVLANRRTPSPAYVPPAYRAPVATTQQPVSNITLYNETRRRDNIIKALVDECKFSEGQIVLSAVKGEEYVINKICKCYAHMGADAEWPANDNPMIVTITSMKDKTVSFCTTNYLKAKT